jgi:signal transduction histidine kinase
VDSERPHRTLPLVIGLSVLLPATVIAVAGSLRTHHDLTHTALARRESVAYLAAETLKGRFDRVRDIGVSLATRVRFRELVSRGRWEEAVAILREVPGEFPFIERLFLTDADGTLLADVPAIPGVHGKNFAFRDWYKGVSAAWKPYFSDVYQRAAEPRYNVVALAVPVRHGDRVTGVLVLQLRLDTLFEWTAGVEVEGGGAVYAVDRLGQVAAHPRYDPQGPVMDFSSEPVVRRALAGEMGLSRGPGSGEPEEQVSAFAPVEGYGWAVVVQQPSRTVFEGRDRALAIVSVIYALSLLLLGFLAAFVVSVVDELRRASRDLHAANRELESFSYSVSHDLRAPLRAIDGFAQALAEDEAPRLSPGGKATLDRVQAAARRMSDLIDDMLSLARLARAELNARPLDLSDLARRLGAELKEGTPGRDVEFVVQDGLRAAADPHLVRSVLLNLLENAWKYTSKTPAARVEFGVRTDGVGRAFFVRDNGVGFDMAHAGKLFGVFIRLHDAREYPGTGVGLAIVQRVIQRHGGRVWAESAVGRGTTFYFTLPQGETP